MGAWEGEGEGEEVEGASGVDDIWGVKWYEGEEALL